MTDWTKYGQAEETSGDLTPSSSADEPVTEDSQDAPERPVSLRPVPNGTDWTAKRQPYETEPPEQSKAKPQRVQDPRIGNKGFAIMFGSVIAVGILTCVGLWVASPIGDDEPQAQATPEASQAANTTPAPPTTAPEPVSDIKLGGKCDGAEGTAVEPNIKTPHGAVAAFQRAYYKGDKQTLLKTVTDTSGLKKQDWDKVFKSLDKKSTYCLEMKPIDNSEIPVTLTVTDSKGKSTTYSQLVSVSENAANATWQISQIRKAN